MQWIWLVWNLLAVGFLNEKRDDAMMREMETRKKVKS
jgi:hypothetical protein